VTLRNDRSRMSIAHLDSAEVSNVQLYLLLANRLSEESAVATIDLSREYFTLPPSAFYVTDEVFAEEYEKVFSRQWIYVGHVSQWPKRGSFLTLEFAGEKLIVVRGDGDQFHGHFNVCRHRGYPLCEAKTGSVRALVCPYHQWRFDLDGRLNAAPGMQDGQFFDFGDFGLKGVNVDTWHGMVFMHIGDEPEPLDQVLGGWDSAVARFDLPRTRLAHEETMEFEANWKVTAENLNECYHCAGTHASLCNVVDVPRMQGEAEDWFDLSRPEGAFAGGSLGMPMHPGRSSMSLDGSLISEKLLGACSADDVAAGHNVGINLLPNYFYAGMYVDHWWAQTVYPVSTTRSRMDFRWYVREDAVEGVDYDVEKLTSLMRTTYVEDIELIENTYAGMRTRSFSPGPIVAKNEPLMYSFVTAYWQLMGYPPGGPTGR
jgi:Rieske 2Fe-2S family protein